MATIRLDVTPVQFRMLRRAICVAMADSMSAVRADTLTYPPDRWKELFDFLAQFEPQALTAENIKNSP